MTKEQKGLLVIGFVTFSLLPIWRCAAEKPNMNFWQYANISFLRSPGSYPHIPIDEAIEEARRAYCEVMGLDYEQSYSSHRVSRYIGTPVPSGVG